MTVNQGERYDVVMKQCRGLWGMFPFPRLKIQFQEILRADTVKHQSNIHSPVCSFDVTKCFCDHDVHLVRVVNMRAIIRKLSATVFVLKGQNTFSVNE